MAKNPPAVPSGPFLRLRGLPSASLPPASATPAELIPFIRAILREAVPLVDSIVPSSTSTSSNTSISSSSPTAAAALSKRKSPWRSKGRKTFSTLADGTREVEILARKVSGAELDHLAGRPPSSSNNSSNGNSSSSAGNHHAAGGATEKATGAATAASLANPQQQQQQPPKSPSASSLSGASSSSRRQRQHRRSSAERSAQSATGASSSAAAGSKKEARRGGGDDGGVGAPPDVAGVKAVPTTGTTTTVTTEAVAMTRRNTINGLASLTSNLNGGGGGGMTKKTTKDGQGGGGGGGGDVDNSKTGAKNPPGPLGEAESWFCRLSTHPDAARAGTASWAEFRRGFKEEHRQTEKAFTKSIVSAEVLRQWKLGGGGDDNKDEKPVVVDVTVPCMGSRGGSDEAVVKTVTYGSITMELIEMRHKVGRPVLRDRVFPIVQLVASVMVRDGNDQQEGGQVEKEEEEEKEEAAEKNMASGSASSSWGAKGKANNGASPPQQQRLTETAEFLVVSIPVLDACTARDKVVVGSYASVERIRKLAGSSGGGSSGSGSSKGKEKDDGMIEWLMAVTSDARGSLPAALQDAALPGKIAQDVPLFVGWAEKQRGAASKRARAGDVTANDSSNKINNNKAPVSKKAGRVEENGAVTLNSAATVAAAS